MALPTVSIVIPSYNMAWCVARAVKSCEAQSFAVDRIIVVDDYSTDDTEAVVRALATANPRIAYHRLESNSGHLGALASGIGQADTDWIALLDADDELTANSIEARVAAAERYRRETGVTPQLVYGDQSDQAFTRLNGYVFPYLCKELSLCQTSTIMLGREAAPYFPAANPYNTDDEIVLAVGKRFPIVHSGAIVTVYHQHDSASRMSNDSRRVLEGVRKLVRDHREDILEQHGALRLVLWRLRVAKALLSHRRALVSERIAAEPAGVRRLLLGVYGSGLAGVGAALRRFLRLYFEHDYF